ncbi:unnamed protein product [Acanthoscelides obtectus]|uniref:Uncharacterized protein n=1 Tax=Acanthoscelides obtectus TaxID=200917 RepID=A0A9P0L5V5_ACAOB|nr:unnamed protein product [Acanthoscelides obtectus]CAK1633044.1 SCAN domain-containing protein 3 [Acanthoscelides obtectus]
MVSTHCVIHRQALAFETLPQKLRQTLDSAIRIVNYIKGSALNSPLFTLLCEDLDTDHKVLLFHTEVRWLSKGNTLARLYELKEEVPTGVFDMASTSSGKKRTYKEAFLQWGFTSIVDKNIEKPQCVLCNKVLNPESMKPSKLKEHFAKVHKEFADKNIDFFKKKERILKSSRMDSTGNIQKANESCLQASYKIAYRIARNKKPHTIGEDLIKPCLLDAVALVIGEQHVAKIKQISLSNTTIQRRICEMSADILAPVISEIKESHMFALQLDESTDVASCSQLLVFTRYIKDDDVKEEYLFCKSLPTTTRGEDVFQTLKEFIEENGLDWLKLIGTCTDGAPSMMGIRSGFQALVKQVAPQVLRLSLLDTPLRFGCENASIRFAKHVE